MKKWRVFWGFFLAVFFLDQLTKFLVASLLGEGRRLGVFPGFCEIVLVKNPGGVFGLPLTVPLFYLFATLFLALLVFFLLGREGFLRGYFPLALGLQLGGATGNLLDRLRLGYVVDFLDLGFWPVFNLADAAITVGVLVFCWELLRISGKGGVASS